MPTVLRTAVQYALRTAVRTTALLVDERTYLKTRYSCRVNRCLRHLRCVRTHCTCWCAYCMRLLLMYVRTLKIEEKYQHCCKYVPTAVRAYHCIYLVLVCVLMYVRTYCTYCCSYWWTCVPTLRTALTNGTNAHILRKTVILTVRTYFSTYKLWCMYLYIAVRTSCTYCNLVMTYTCVLSSH